MAKNSDFKRLIEQFPRTRILVIGDLMIDRFIRGKVSRISPEAPVPVVQVREEHDVPGGAGNVIMNLASLGAQVTSCGVIGEDSAGEKLLEHFRTFGIQTGEVRRDPSRPSTIKTRVIAEHQQVVRFDHETSKEIPREIQSDILDSIPQLVRETDAIILSDYGKGVITESLLTQTIANAKKLKRPVCVDPKLEHFLKYKHVTCITPNLAEAMGGMNRVKVDGTEGVGQLGRDILKTLKCASVLITQGENGMTLFERGKSTHIPAKAQEVFDVTGAGDTVISVLALCLACGASLVDAAILANLAAGIVVGKLGTATVKPQELREALERL